MPFFDVINGTTVGGASLWNQYGDALSAKNDTPISTYAPISAPGAPTVSVNTASGNLSGAYQYKVAFITGYWEGPVGTGTFHAQGNTGGGTASATVSPSSEEVDLSSIPTGGTGVYQRILYRTKAGGTSFFELATLTDNTTTTYTDNTTDANLGAAMPTSNTTGSDMTVGKDLSVPNGGGTFAKDITVPSVNTYPTDTSATADSIAVRDINGNVAVTDVTGRVNPNLGFNTSWQLGSAGWTGINSNGFTVEFGSGGEGTFLNNSTSIGSTGVSVDSTTFPLSSGVEVTLSADMYAIGVSSGTMQTTVNFLDGSGNYLGQIALDATNTIGWKRYSATGTSPANTASAKITAAFAANTSNTNASWKRIKVEEGSVATAYSDDSTLNTVQFASNFAGVFSGADTWHQPTLLNGWVNFGGGNAVAAYRKDADGYVHLKGLIKGGSANSNAFQLPPGYIPLEDHYFSVAATEGYGEIKVASNGYVAPTVLGSTWTAIECVFLAEQ